MLFVLTGNNLSLGSDELTRWLPVHLNSKSPRPQERTFKQPDVVAHALSIREAVLRDVIGIIAGYIASNETMPTASRFSNWDRMVRQPLIWAGGLDVATVFADNMDKGESTGAALAAVKALTAILGKEKFTATRLASQLSTEAKFGHGSAPHNLKAVSYTHLDVYKRQVTGHYLGPGPHGSPRQGPGGQTQRPSAPRDRLGRDARNGRAPQPPLTPLSKDGNPA